MIEDIKLQLKQIEVREKDVANLEKMKILEKKRSRKSEYKQTKIKIMNGVRIIYIKKDE